MGYPPTFHRTRAFNLPTRSGHSRRSYLGYSKSDLCPTRNNWNFCRARKPLRDEQALRSFNNCLTDFAVGYSIATEIRETVPRPRRFHPRPVFPVSRSRFATEASWSPLRSTRGWVYAVHEILWNWKIGECLCSTVDHAARGRYSPRYGISINVFTRPVCRGNFILF